MARYEDGAEIGADRCEPVHSASKTDVILHISYTAKDDGRFRDEVEGDLANRFEALATESGITRNDEE